MESRFASYHHTTPYHHTIPCIPYHTIPYIPYHTSLVWWNDWGKSIPPKDLARRSGGESGSGAKSVAGIDLSQSFHHTKLVWYGMSNVDKPHHTTPQHTTSHHMVYERYTIPSPPRSGWAGPPQRGHGGGPPGGGGGGGDCILFIHHVM